MVLLILVQGVAGLASVGAGSLVGTNADFVGNGRGLIGSHAVGGHEGTTSGWNVGAINGGSPGAAASLWVFVRVGDGLAWAGKAGELGIDIVASCVVAGGTECARAEVVVDATELNLATKAALRRAVKGASLADIDG